MDFIEAVINHLFVIILWIVIGIIISFVLGYYKNEIKQWIKR